MSDAQRQGNRRSWNAATRAHNSHKRDQAGFLSDGGSTLFADELDLLGALDGRSLVHLQCNSGQDTLSLARHGAEVTGVDISDEAIAAAVALAGDSGIAARFVCADVYEWFEAARRAGERFDIAFYSYGALPWLDDLAGWAHGIAAVLRPGGRVVGIDVHPLALMFDEDWQLRYPYGSGATVVEEPAGVHDYVAESGSALTPSGWLPGETDFVNPHMCYEYYWSVGQVVEALLGAGLRLERLVEYPHSNGCRSWKRMRELPGRRFAPPAELPRLPLMFGVVAALPAS